MQALKVVNIRRLRRRTSEVVREAENSDRPIFVTQFACVAAVMLPRSMYDRLLRAAEAGRGDLGGVEASDRGQGAPGDGVAARTAAERIRPARRSA